MSEIIYGALYNTKWFNHEDGGRFMQRKFIANKGLDGLPVLGWAAYERRDGSIRYYGDISSPFEYASKFILGEEVEVLT